MSRKNNPSGRPNGKPVRVRKGWLVKVGFPHTVEGEAGGSIDIPALYLEGTLSGGVWINNAGVDGEGQKSFKVSGHPDFLDELADAFRLLADDIRKSSGWIR